MADVDRSAAIAALEAEGLDVTEWTDEPHASYDEHTHPFREVRIVLDGTMTMTVDGATRRLSPGARIDLEPGRAHSCVVGSDGVHYLAGSASLRAGQGPDSLPAMSEGAVTVVTDSSAVVPNGWLDRLPIRIVPLEIAWADGRLDRGDRPFAEVAQALRAASVPPKTAAPSPGNLQTLFTELLESSAGVLMVCPASDLSTTFNSATLAARELGDDRVRVLDGGTAAAGQGMVAVEAAKTSETGAALADVVARAEAVASRVQVWATLSQLEFLNVSGRLPAIAAVGLRRLGLQPIVRYAGSSPAPVAVTRGTKRATDRLYRAWESSIPPADGNAALHAVAFHSARDEDAADLIGRIRGRVPTSEAELVEVTASLASHTGPGLLGLAWFWDF